MYRQHPNHIMVAYAFSYDVNMIIKDFSVAQQRKLCDGQWVSFSGYRVKWIPKKWVEIRRGASYFKIYDVFTFFGCSFVSKDGETPGACEQYLGWDDPDLVAIRNGKGLRNEFQWSELETIIRPYMYKELRMMVRLCSQLRSLLATIDVQPKGWHGPGAIATALLKKEKVIITPDVDYVRNAAQYAYAGGRFESFRTGIYNGPVFQYDIRSAYPYALTMCPNLDSAYSVAFGLDNPPDFSLVKTTYHNPDMPRNGINPFFVRHRNSIFYPNGLWKGWVWGIEYKAAKKYWPDHITSEQVILFDTSNGMAFDWVEDLYEKRAKWKREHNPAQLAAKLGMNSVYGKLAQRVGWDQVMKKAPRYHQLRWAGFITATCRAKMYDAMMQNSRNIIAIETDGIFSQVPLDLDIGEGLGQFEQSLYDGILYIQSGVYFTTENGDWSKGKTRGFSANKANIDVALDTVAELAPLKISEKRFMSIPDRIGQSNWRAWESNNRTIHWGGSGKRFHDPERCDACTTNTQWHDTIWTLPGTYESAPHDLPWIG